MVWWGHIPPCQVQQHHDQPCGECFTPESCPRQLLHCGWDFGKAVAGNDSSWRWKAPQRGPGTSWVLREQPVPYRSHLHCRRGGGCPGWEAEAAGSPAEKPKPPEEVSAHPGGSAGGKAGEHGRQEGKFVLLLLALPTMSQCRDARSAANRLIILEQPKH